MGYRARYGISPQGVHLLYNKYYRMKDTSDFYDLEDFLMYAAAEGYEEGMNMGRKNPNIPHGHGNTYFFADPEWVSAVPDFCKGCTRECPTANSGCEAYKRWYVDNWNKNIHVPGPNARLFWQYEHPDLVREGIVFENRPD